ncbi:PRC-barrel domain-containing protein [Pseudooceanicola nitratireducens]|uniref:PRC-barrel domain-containing protein n=1 Tax=Pseudooceanicola nitratireducens TaxID=517719 RepID=UPI0023F390DA|nr:PRC-barrel domain-containing protein [Pseudooceanicola nitratireducens]
MSNVKNFFMTSAAVLALAAPVAAQSIGAGAGVSGDAAGSIGADGASASIGLDSDVSASADDTGLNAQTGLTGTADADVATDTEMAETDATDMPAGAEAGTKVGALIGADVASATGDTIGEIDDVVQMNGETMAVVGVGGFLGLGEHDVALPLTELALNGETVTAMGYTRDQLEAMAEFNADTAISLEADQVIDLGQS